MAKRRGPAESAGVMPSPCPPAYAVDAPRTHEVSANESESIRSIRPEPPAGTSTLRNPREKTRSSKPIPPSLGDRRMARGDAAAEARPTVLGPAGDVASTGAAWPAQANELTARQ